MKRAVIYLRVSTSRQVKRDMAEDGLSLPAQREACTRKAEALDSEVVDEYVDRGETAKSNDRPALQEMLRRFKEKHDIDYLIVHKLDRFARNSRDDANMTFEIAAAGVTLVSVMENIDDSPSGELLHTIMAAQAQFLSSNLAHEVLKGMNQKVKNGGTVTRVPTGYHNVFQRYHDHTIRTVALDLDRAPLIKEAFELYATGDYSIIALTDILQARGFTIKSNGRSRKGVLHPQSVNKILTNPYYCGMIMHQGVLYPGRHDPIVSTELFERVQTLLKSRRSGEKERRHTHYLRGTVFCGFCGARLCITYTKERYLYYFCVNRRKTNCPFMYEYVDEIESAVQAEYANVSMNNVEVERIYGAVKRSLDNSKAIAEAESRRQNDRIQKLKVEREKLMNAYYAGAVPLDMLGAEQSRIARELGDAERVLASAKKRFEDIQDTLNVTLQLIQGAAKTYAQSPDTVRRMLNQAFFEKVFIDPDGEGHVTAHRTIVAEPFAAVLVANRELSLGSGINTPKSETLGLASRNKPIFLAQSSDEDFMVKLQGLEPWTFCMPCRRSSQLSYSPAIYKTKLYQNSGPVARLMEMQKDGGSPGQRAEDEHEDETGDEKTKAESETVDVGEGARVRWAVMLGANCVEQELVGFGRCGHGCVLLVYRFNVERILGALLAFCR